MPWAPYLDAARAHVLYKAEAQRFGGLRQRHGGSLVFKGLDMTQVHSVEIGVFASVRMNHRGGHVEVRLGDSQGSLMGQADIAASAPAASGSHFSYASKWASRSLSVLFQS